MKYLGNGSLSSFMNIALRIFWFALLIVSVIGLCIAVFAITAAPGTSPFPQQMVSEFRHSLENGVSAKELEEWNAFVALPVYVRVLVIPYFIAVAGLLLSIIGHVRRVFENFTRNVVFDESNTARLSAISKLNIAFSILTVNLSLLVVSIVLFILCAVFKKGSDLQEDLNLTV